MSAMDTVVQLMSKVWELMTSNPILALFVAAGLLPVGIVSLPPCGTLPEGNPKGAWENPTPRGFER